MRHSRDESTIRCWSMQLLNSLFNGHVILQVGSGKTTGPFTLIVNNQFKMRSIPLQFSAAALRTPCILIHRGTWVQIPKKRQIKKTQNGALPNYQQRASQFHVKKYFQCRTRINYIVDSNLPASCIFIRCPNRLVGALAKRPPDLLTIGPCVFK